MKKMTGLRPKLMLWIRSMTYEVLGTGAFAWCHWTGQESVNQGWDFAVLSIMNTLIGLKVLVETLYELNFQYYHVETALPRIISCNFRACTAMQLLNLNSLVAVRNAHFMSGNQVVWSWQVHRLRKRLIPPVGVSVSQTRSKQPLPEVFEIWNCYADLTSQSSAADFCICS
jgi:hypothetical protein